MKKRPNLKKGFDDSKEKLLNQMKKIRIEKKRFQTSYPLPWVKTDIKKGTGSKKDIDKEKQVG